MLDSDTLIAIVICVVVLTIGTVISVAHKNSCTFFERMAKEGYEQVMTTGNLSPIWQKVR